MVNNKTPYESVRESGALDNSITEEQFNSRLGDLVNVGIYMPITYSELVVLRDEGKLKAGAFYRITDYKTTTTQSGTRVADYPYQDFDIIVQATSENTISEDATTTNGCKVKYSLSNDKSRFLWADTVNGKGVIYRMIDGHNNDCPYDFKNILFKHDEEWYYTFGALDATGAEELSMARECYDNYIAPIRFNADNTSASGNIFGMPLPCVIFDCQNWSNGKGIVRNRIEVGVKSAYIKAQAIFDNVWKENCYNSLIEEVYIKSSSQMFGNTIEGQAKRFIIGNLSDVHELKYNKIELPQLVHEGEVTLNGYSYARNIFNLKNTKGNFHFSNGSLFDNYIEDIGSRSGNNEEGGVSLNTLTVLYASKIRIQNSLDIVYTNSTAGKTPLRFLNIDARGWGDTTLTIPTSFPPNANYELKIAKNSAGDVKMWCEADLVN